MEQLDELNSTILDQILKYKLHWFIVVCLDTPSVSQKDPRLLFHRINDDSSDKLRISLTNLDNPPSQYYTSSNWASFRLPFFQTLQQSQVIWQAKFPS